MKIIHTTALTDQQKNQGRSRVEICKQKEPVSLSAPSEDGLDYFLAYDHEDSLAGFLFLYFTDDQICECTAFTAPDHRKQGVFTKLLNMALDAADAYEKEEKTQVDFCFLIDENTPSAMAVMELLEAEYWYSEYKMARACREALYFIMSKVVEFVSGLIENIFLWLLIVGVIIIRLFKSMYDYMLQVGLYLFFNYDEISYEGKRNFRKDAYFSRFSVDKYGEERGMRENLSISLMLFGLGVVLALIYLII